MVSQTLTISLSGSELGVLTEYCQKFHVTETDVLRDCICSLPQSLSKQPEEPSTEQLLAELATLKQEKADLERLLVTTRAEQVTALHDSEERYRLLYENTPVMLHSIDHQGRIIDVNNYWLQKLGYERSEVIGAKSTDFLTPESHHYAQEVVLPQFFQTGVCLDIPYQMVCKNGDIIDVVLSAFAQKDESGQIIRSLAVLIDVTEQKRTETALIESEQRYRLLSNLNPAGIWGTDAQGNCTYANEKTLLLTGLSTEEILGDGWAKNLHPDDLEMMVTTWKTFVEQSCLGNPVEYKVECRYLFPDGSTIWTLAQGVPERNLAGEVVGFIGILIDINERKQMEEALRQSEAHHRAIVDAIPDLMLRVRRDGFCLESIPPKSDRAGKFLPIEKHISQVLPPALLQQQLQAIEQTLTTGEVQVYEHQIEKFSSVYDEEVRISPLADDEVLILVCDIAERKQAERERDRFFTLSLDMLCIANFEGYFLRLNPAWSKVLGYTQTELMARPYIEFVHPEDRSRTIAEAKKIQTGVNIIEFENRYRCKDGTYRWLQWTAAPDVENGTIYCVVHDITQRHRAEAELQKSYKELSDIKYALDQAALVTITDTEGKITYINDKFSEISQYEPSELLGQDHRILKSGYHSKQLYKNLWSTLKSGKIWRGEIKNKAKDGSYFWLDSTIVPFLDEQGQPFQYLAIRTEITDRKEAEEALRIAEENYRSIFENALEGIFQSTPDGRYIRINPAMAQIHGYQSPQEMMTAIKQIHEQIYVNPQCRREFQELMAQKGEVKGFQYQVYRRDGNLIWVEENTRAVRDRSGNLRYYEGIIQDITQRKQKEEALKLQIEKLTQIDQKKRQREVAEVMGTDYFQQLQAEVDELRLNDEIDN